MTERMQKIADRVGKDDVVADIGTDHGYIPIWLIQNNACKNVILADINDGPLEKAQENISKYLPDRSLDLRHGSGISVLQHGEADTVIIAGMGGILIRDILADDLEKTKSIPKYILQPRNHGDELRMWIEEVPWLSIRDESLAKEAGRLCEIMTVECIGSDESEADRKIIWELQKELNLSDELLFEIPLVFFMKQEPYAWEFLQNKIDTQKAILQRILQNGLTEASRRRVRESEKRLRELERIAAYF